MNIIPFDTAMRGHSGHSLAPISAPFTVSPQSVVDGLLASIFRDAPSDDDAQAKIILALLAVAKGYRRETRQ